MLTCKLAASRALLKVVDENAGSGDSLYAPIANVFFVKAQCASSA